MKLEFVRIFLELTNSLLDCHDEDFCITYAIILDL